jgi:hypothetical protein
VSAVAGSIALYVGFYLFVGVIFVILRLALGPGKYGEIAEGLAAFLLMLLFGGILFVFWTDIGSDPTAAIPVVLGSLLFLLFGLWGLLFCTYELRFAKRPEVELDAEGVRLKTAFYTLIPWADVVGIETRVSMWQEVGPFLFLAEGRGVRTVRWPFRTQRLGLVVRGDQASLNEVADIIRRHPNYRGKSQTV